MAFHTEIALSDGSTLELKGATMRTHLNILHNGEPVGKLVYLLSKGKFEKEIAGSLVRIEYKRQKGSGRINLVVKVDGEVVKESYVTG